MSNRRRAERADRLGTRVSLFLFGSERCDGCDVRGSIGELAVVLLFDGMNMTMWRISGDWGRDSLWKGGRSAEGSIVEVLAEKHKVHRAEICCQDGLVRADGVITLRDAAHRIHTPGRVAGASICIQ